jgi:hypothetical protein
MAFHDITKCLYPREDGKNTIKLDYKDKAHRYYIRERIDFDRDESDAKAWGKVVPGSVGVTTLMGDTLEKKGLMNYAMTKALMYLFGFYEFKTDDGEKKIGYSKKGAQSLWDGETLKPLTRDEALEEISYGSKASLRHTKKGADIGSVVHDAIEHYVLNNTNLPTPVLTDDGVKLGKDGKPVMKIQNHGQPAFDIEEQYMANLRDAEYETEYEKEMALKDFPLDVEMAKKAYNRFVLWWETTNPLLYAAEDVLYSKKHHIPGTYDADLGIPIEQHPVPEMFKGKTHVRCTTDWKTSNASVSKEAAAPEGVYYTYFLQDAIYEIARREMGMPPADDLLVVSARKDGEFTPLFASELGLTVDECLEWAECVIYCHKMMKRIKAGLLKHGESAPAPKNEKLKLLDEEF